MPRRVSRRWSDITTSSYKQDDNPEKKVKLICQKYQLAKVFYIQHKIIYQNRTDIEKNGISFITASVI